MSQEYKRGSIIEFPSMASREWIILNIYMEENVQYLLIAPYNVNDLKSDAENIDFTKTTLVKTNNDGSTVIVTDKDEVRKIIDIGI